MTTRSYTDGDEIPAQPTVRSAWDAVKREVTLGAIGSGVTALNVGLLGMYAAQGHTGVAVGWGVIVILNAYPVASCAVRACRILKNIPAPKP